MSAAADPGLLMVFTTDAPRVHALILTSVFGFGITSSSTSYKCHNDDKHDRRAIDKCENECQPFRGCFVDEYSDQVWAFNIIFDSALSDAVTNETLASLQTTAPL